MHFCRHKLSSTFLWCFGREILNIFFFNINLPFDTGCLVILLFGLICLPILFYLRFVMSMVSYVSARNGGSAIATLELY